MPIIIIVYCFNREGDRTKFRFKRILIVFSEKIWYRSKHISGLLAMNKRIKLNCFYLLCLGVVFTLLGPGRSLAQDNNLDYAQETIMRGALSMPSLGKMKLWGNFELGAGKLDTNIENHELDQDLKGGMIGLNYRLGTNLTLFGYYNYNVGTTKFESDWKDVQTTNLGGLGLHYKYDNIYFVVQASGGMDEYAYTDLYRNWESEFDGYQVNGLFEAGAELQKAGLFVFKPYTSLMYNTLQHDSFDRLNGVVLDDKDKYKAFYSTMGARINLNLGFLKTFNVQVRGAWVHQLMEENDPIYTMTFSRIPGTVIPTQFIFDGDPGRDFFQGGAGLRLTLFNKIAFTADYDLLANKHQTNHLGSLGLLLSF